MTHRIVTDLERCVGAGQCVLTDPGLFDQSLEDGTVIVVQQPADEARLAHARTAVHLCPSGALSLVDAAD